MNRFLISLSGRVCIAATLLTSVGFAQGFSEGSIPYFIRDRTGAGAIRKGHQEGTIRTDTFDKRVTIMWSSSALANQAPNWSLLWDVQENTIGTARTQNGTQELSIRYFPTASCTLDPQAIMVAGVSTTGQTIIERWQLAWPQPMPSVVVNPQTGTSEVAVALPSVTEVQRLYSADVPGKRFVKNLCALRRSSGAPQACLVQFDDSNDVYLLNWNPVQLSLVASSTTAGGSLGVVAGLEPKDHSGIAFGVLSGVGYTYVLHRGFKRLPQQYTLGAPPVVIFVDSNRDGALDLTLSITETQYRDQGWANADNYANWWLY